MINSVGILLSSANLAACLSGKPSYEVMSLYDAFARQNKLRPIFFQLSHINFHDLTVGGYVKSGHHYVQKKWPLPTVIHNRTRLSPLHEKPLSRLRELPFTKVFNGTNYFNKWRVYRLLRQCKELIPHLPDTHHLQASAISDLLERHPAVYVKPFAKSLGRGILKCVGLPDEKVQLSFQKGGSVYQRVLEKERAMPFIRTMTNHRYLVQQAIPLAGQGAKPTDFRVSVQKGRTGVWGITGIVARVGLERAIVTNVAAGSSCVPARTLLKEQFPKSYRHIYAQMKAISLRIAKQLEQHDPACADLGLDLAVDQDGHVWFIEVNGRDLRVTFRLAGEQVMWRDTFRRPMEYAAYLIRQQAPQKSHRPSVAIVTPGTLPLLTGKGGSVETVAEKLAQHLAAGTNVRTFGKATATVKENEIGLIRIHGKDKLTYLKRVIAQLRRLPSDIIQIENRPTYVPLIRQALPRTRIVLTLHSLTYVNRAVLSTHTLTRACEAADTIVTNSDFLKREVAKLLPRPATPIQRIHLGVDTNVFRPVNSTDETRARLREQLKLGDRPTVLFIGRLIPQKGLHVLLDAMAHVHKQVPDATLVVIGSPFYGRNSATRYVRQIKAHPVVQEGRIRFIPFISPQKIHQYYHVGDVFVTPSIGKEAFGLVNVEAMASGLPVVAHDVGGISEIIEHGETGYLTKPAAPPEQLAHDIATLLTDDQKRFAFGHAGRKRVETHFSWESVAANYRTLYDSLIGKES